MDNRGPDSEHRAPPAATLYPGCFKTRKFVYGPWTHIPPQDQTSLPPTPTLPAAVSLIAPQDYSIKPSEEDASGLLASPSSLRPLPVRT